MGSGDISSLLADMFGDEFTSGTDAFKENLIRQFKLTDVSKYADLVETGEHETNQVQKHSDALAFGTDAGYNAMLPYWAEQGGFKEKDSISFRTNGNKD